MFSFDVICYLLFKFQNQSLAYVFHGFEWHSQGKWESPYSTFSQTAKLNTFVTQSTFIINKSRLFHEHTFILKLSAVGVIGVCRGEYA